MSLYSINKNYPTEELPKRIRKSDGTTVTDLKSLSVSALKDLGIVSVDPAPNHDDNTQKLSWDGDKWVVSSFSDEEKETHKNNQWELVRNHRDAIIENTQWRIERYLSEVRRGVSPTDDITKIDAYIEELRQIPQKQDDPYNITYPQGIDEKGDD